MSVHGESVMHVTRSMHDNSKYRASPEAQGYGLDLLAQVAE